jgi:lipopolysaccharide transport system ATP-binding protein
MTDIAIRVENLSKQYRIGSAQQARYKTLRDSLTDMVTAPFRRVASLVRGEAYGAAEMDETIWALKDVSFEVKRGEVVGIIGRNGAGKSTLLKILSRITEPTEGRAEIHGRVGSLLEVGTGFHPELTGRENIYLNGAILGMTREEIERKFDEIVAFAELAKFLDTPVKFYSSGMYVRLAFAVAAHLEPEILLVDEVLSVGDAAFQKKCLGKMGDVAKSGRTVLFVSHNMTSISALCLRALWIDKGMVVRDGVPDRVIQAYLSEGVSDQPTVCFEKELSKAGQITQISIKTVDSFPSNVLQVDRPFQIQIVYEIREKLNEHRVGLVIRDMNGVIIFVSNSSDFSANGTSVDPGAYLAEVKIPELLLNVGIYSVTCYLGEPNVHRIDTRENATRFEITGTPYRSNEAREVRPGLLVYPFDWSVRKVSRHAC